VDEQQAFGRYVRQRRREMDLTQEELARRVGCAAITIRKIEAEDARPSVQIAERLAMALAIPLDDRAEFVRRARAIRPDVDEALPTPPPSLDEIGSEDLTGRAIRGYALSEKIGSGGMGAVYRAIQPVVEREVAIKIILPMYANHPDFIRRFETEAQLVARLEHPYIVPLYDYWREPGVAYLVMRLLRGGSLQRLIQEGLLPIESVARLLEQIGSALMSAHRIGVIHRDLKPANILLDEDQNAYLADFGIAKNLGNPDLSDQTQAGAVIGSPQYMSPEQIRSLSVRPQSDIYCLGVMLYEMLTGKAPFIGPTPIDYIQQHISAPMPSLAAHRTGLPASLDAVIARATVKNPEERYSDVPSMLAEFRQAVSGVIAQPVTLIEQEEKLVGEIVNPYKGLRSFSEADADDFFGRETLVQQLLARLSEGGDISRFLAIMGPSGSGKSSVVKAGLIPALRRGGLLGSESWFYVDLLPGSKPFEELEAALLRIAVNPPASLLGQLKENRGLIRAINRLLPNDSSVELVLVIDQFEELFTLLQSEEERALFLSNIVTAILDERSRVRVIITLRADFIDRPLHYVDFGELIQRRNELVLPLTPDELEQAILGPAKRVGLKVETGLVSAILRDLGDQPGTLPMLQYALTELFDQREGNVLTKQGYQNINGVLGALGRRAEEVFSALNENDQSIARQIFLRLVTLGEGIEDTRRRVLLMELEHLQAENEAAGSVSNVLESFSKTRLLTFDNDPITRSPTVEVAHEALLREWSRLRGWLYESRADVRLQRQLANAAHEWREAAHDESFLLTGAHLEQFDAWSRTTEVAFTEGEREFLNASLDFAKREEAARAEQQAREATLRQRVQRALQVLVGVLLVAAIVSGGLAFWANNQRQNAQTQAAILLAGQAETELTNGYHDRAVLLALAALENYPYTSQAEHALARAVSYDRALRLYNEHASAVTSIAWSSDGKLVACSGSNDNNIHIWDSETGKRIKVIDMPEGITGNKLDMALHVQWSPDGKHLLAITGDRYTLGSQDYDILLWDANTGELISSIEIANDTQPESGELGVTFVNYPTGGAAKLAPQSGRLATLGGDNTALIWNADWEKIEIMLSGHTKSVNSVDWSPDETRLVTASLDGTARVWDSNTGSELYILEGHEGRVEIALWSLDGVQLATAGEDGTIRIWNPENGELIRMIEANAGPISSLAWSPNSKRLVAGYSDGSIRIWEVDSGKLLENLRGHQGIVSDLEWSPVDDRLASADGSGNVRIWNAAYSTAWRLYPPQAARGGDWTVQGASWSSNGRYLAMAGGDPFGSTEPPSFEIWDVEENQLTMKTLGDKLNFMGLEAHFSPDNALILYLGFPGFPDFSGLATAYVFDAKTGEIVQTFTPGGENLIRSAAWSPDGSQVATGLFNNQIIIWDYKTGRQIVKLVHSNNEAMFINYIEWSPDGSKIASASDESSFQVWDTRTWKSLFTLHHQPPAFGLTAAWSPDGKRLLTAGGNDEQGAKDNTARVWDAVNGKELLVFAYHTKSVWPGDWSPNGKRIVTAGNDGTVRIWDASTGAELLTLYVPAGYGIFGWWSPDGKHIALVGNETLVSVWNVWQTTEDLITYAKDCCVVRELAPEERQQFGLR
jgi:WD40 repeat protein/serine/threonine protein kinase/DNA-binding XRE family transcriptional regulator